MDSWQELQLVVDKRAELGEGPSWDKINKRLLWVDIFGQKIHAFYPETGEQREWKEEAYVTSVVPVLDQGVVVTLPHGIYRVDLADSSSTLLAEVELDRLGNRCNDAKCDPQGRLWVGTMDRTERQPTGNLYRLSKAGPLRQVVSGVTISNGLAWSPDGQVMYYIDSPTHQVMAYDFDSVSGGIAHPRVAVTVPPQLGMPDGMTVDAQGTLWVCLWGGSRVTQWNPLDGQLLGEILIPAPNVTSCAFAGDSLDELYITTARTGLNAETLAQFPHTGGLFRVKTRVPGLPTQAFVQ
ncbi:SMP-30/gluconolactonase/LRE family protein [Alicyclobacillaceae bacterium I2511]|nr:SMP-30/gluconolactonase/LRE family protein [Alicyclobacillaceae bacterium I2511]